tara:strand:- start:125 stop:1060 length:936 start_codon:yes stop_codon:yes gene_type:complete
MTIGEMHTAINLGVQKIASFQVDLFLPAEIDLEINKNIDRFIKQRYNSLGNKYMAGFEESQKRIDDLRTLIVEESVDTIFKGQIDDNVFIDRAAIPVGTEANKKYMFLLNVRALVSYKDCQTIDWTHEYEEDTCACYNGVSGALVPAYTTEFDCVAAGIPHVWTCSYVSLENRIVGNYQTDANGSFVTDDNGDLILLADTHKNTSSKCKFVQLDDIYKLLEDPFNGLSYNQPLYTVVENNLDFYTDDTYLISKVKLTYLTHPTEVDFDNSTDCDLPFHTHQEIVDMTVNSILEGISDPRYQTNQIEVHKSE